MKIPEKLVAAANFNPTKSTFQMSTIDLNKAIEKNEITIPLYQRDVSWTSSKSVDLLNYQLVGKAPVSAISMNKINDISENAYVTQVSLIDREEIAKDGLKHGHLSIVDGQQRLTTNFKAYINDPDFSNIVLDFPKGKFRKVDNPYDDYCIPVGILLNKSEVVLKEYLDNKLHFKDFTVLGVIQAIRNKLQGYNYTINLANDLSEKEQVEWFEVLNNAGSRVTEIQMNFSKLKVDGIDIYNDYTRQFILKLKENGLGDIFNMKSMELSIPVSILNPSVEVVKGLQHKLNFAPIPSDEKSKQICKLNTEEIKDCFKITLEALDKTLGFINQYSLSEPTRIDYISYLIGYFVYNNEVDNETINKLIKWYNSASFTNKSNGERRDMFKDLLDI